MTTMTRARTGIAGLDEIIGGGLPANHLYLIDGAPGSGKTTLALQFLLEGVSLGERGLYVTLSESRDELLDVAKSHGWNLDGIDVFERWREERKVCREEEKRERRSRVAYQKNWFRVRAAGAPR